MQQKTIMFPCFNLGFANANYKRAIVFSSFNDTLVIDFSRLSLFNMAVHILNLEVKKFGPRKTITSPPVIDHRTRRTADTSRQQSLER